ncbi:ATP-binding cassette transporter snq2 [Diatrype stigma]|uniref:ATP-binding cassette transporter snq2 n=1 Tax=Diatrype stigma TaxID=117547 RepID=A0AAN9UXV7_9PEZI
MACHLVTMWSTPLTRDGEAIRRTNSRPQPNPWHQDDDIDAVEAQAAGERASPSGSGSSEPDVDRSGTWGERDVGEIHEDRALQEYEALRNDLIQLHKTRTRDTQASKLSISRTRSHATAKRRFSSAQDDAKNEDGVQIEGGDVDDESEDEFELGEFMREGHFEKRTEAGSSAKKIGLIYENLTVKGVGSTASLVRTVPDAIIGTFGPDLYHLLCRVLPSLRFRKPPTRALIHDFTGCVRDGEMMLVLGRPGSGCSTFLKAVSNNRDSFAAVEGDVSYGGIPAETQKKLYRGEVTYNDEDDVHFASLSVWKTLTFALMNKTKRSAKEEIPIIANALLRMFGISHTKNTLIGDDYIRGVSGGERKRVSIAETLASKSTVIAWDNSTRGLDASTALDYARSLRIMTDISNRTTLVTLYQAGEGIYEVMDKVLVIDQGRQIFCGPAREAKPYFVGLGFECPERQTTADFLTAVTDPNERRFRPGFEHRAPRTAEELERAFRASPNYQRLLADVAEYKRHLHQTGYADARSFEGAVRESKSRNVRKKSPYTVSFPRQVWACSQREFWLLLGDKTALWTKLFIVISNGLIVGSLFHGQALDTAGAFTRGGTAFFSIVFLGWLQMSELSKAVSGRAVVARHDDYAFYRPSAVSLARVVQDFPVVAVQVAIFGLTMYFMTGLAVEAGRFWIYMLYVYTTTMMLTAMYRMFAALSPEIDTAVRFSGIALNLLVIYTGYVLPKTQLLTDYIWFGWLYWVNPISYAFEAVMANEFSGRVMECSPDMLVPQGPGVLPEYQGCALSGAPVNGHSVSGDDYLQTAYSYSRSNLWRNFGVLIAFAVLYIGITAVATELVSFREGGGGALIFKKTRKAKEQKRKAAAPADEEKAIGGGGNGGADSSESSTIMGGSGSGDDSGRQPVREQGEKEEKEESMEKLTKSDAVFTWRDVEYTVPYMGGERRLLNKVSGYAKPGIMVALMGASGAGKTTLLNTLSQRQKTGVVTGDMFVDGSPLGPDFQRNTGFCLQGDIHDRTQTVREAIEFSALLRQEAAVPRAEKLAYVDRIIDLLELGDLQDAIIKSLGVEQRKRLTIGVELAAKPSLLLFLDEPTSGLDSQSAYSIVRFLKKLSRAGQAIVCT